MENKVNENREETELNEDEGILNNINTDNTNYYSRLDDNVSDRILNLITESYDDSKRNATFVDDVGKNVDILILDSPDNDNDDPNLDELDNENDDKNIDNMIYNVINDNLNELNENVRTDLDRKTMENVKNDFNISGDNLESKNINFDNRTTLMTNGEKYNENGEVNMPEIEDNREIIDFNDPNSKNMTASFENDSQTNLRINSDSEKALNNQKSNSDVSNLLNDSKKMTDDEDDELNSIMNEPLPINSEMNEYMTEYNEETELLDINDKYINKNDRENGEVDEIMKENYKEIDNLKQNNEEENKLIGNEDNNLDGNRTNEEITLLNDDVNSISKPPENDNYVINENKNMENEDQMMSDEDYYNYSLSSHLYSTSDLKNEIRDSNSNNNNSDNLDESEKNVIVKDTIDENKIFDDSLVIHETEEYKSAISDTKIKDNIIQNVTNVEEIFENDNPSMPIKKLDSVSSLLNLLENGSQKTLKSEVISNDEGNNMIDGRMEDEENEKMEIKDDDLGANVYEDESGNMIGAAVNESKDTKNEGNTIIDNSSSVDIENKEVDSPEDKSVSKDNFEEIKEVSANETDNDKLIANSNGLENANNTIDSSNSLKLMTLTDKEDMPEEIEGLKMNPSNASLSEDNGTQSFDEIIDSRSNENKDRYYQKEIDSDDDVVCANNLYNPDYKDIVKASIPRSDDKRDDGSKNESVVADNDKLLPNNSNKDDKKDLMGNQIPVSNEYTDEINKKDLEIESMLIDNVNVITNKIDTNTIIDGKIEENIELGILNDNNVDDIESRGSEISQEDLFTRESPFADLPKAEINRRAQSNIQNFSRFYTPPSTPAYSDNGDMDRRRRGQASLQSNLQNGFFVHSNPPRQPAWYETRELRKWIRQGEISHLKQVVLKGDGHRLLGETSPNPKTRAFLRLLPSILGRLEMCHDACTRGRLEDLRNLLDSPPANVPLELSLDGNGLGLLHKAVIFNHLDIIDFLLDNYPHTLDLLDKEKRVALHYAGISSQEAKEKLIEAGADDSLPDNQGFTPAYYMNHPKAITLPEHSKSSKSSGGIKISQVRIWIHERDLEKLLTLLWEGHGYRLARETSKQPSVKKFLDAVPYIMNNIKDVHMAAVKNDLEMLKRRSGPPLPDDLLMSKDANGLNPLHKAAGLGHEELLKALLERVPKAVNLKDNMGRTPLHYCAGLKGQVSSRIQTLLEQHGANTDSKDNKGKTMKDYKKSVKDLEGDKYLRVIPGAPRTHGDSPPSWDWLSEIRQEAGPAAQHSTPSDDSAFGDDTTFNQLQRLEDLTADAEDLNELKQHPLDLDDEGYSGEYGKGDLLLDQGGKPSDEPSTADASELPEEIAPTNNSDDASQSKHESDDSKPDDGSDNMTSDEPGEMAGQAEGQVDNRSQSISPNMLEEESPLQPLDNDEKEEETEVDEALRTSNMEKLAELVLEGNGKLLVDKVSDNPDVQLFINNVPLYMNKISGIHKACRQGDLRGVQTNLDRRKFAVAIDNSTPLKPTPLHVATLFGRATVLRYMAGRFPETMHSQDAKGRTPLHYSATLPDNGHLYSLLITLGADKTITDDEGNTAEHYMKNGGLSYQALMDDYQNRTEKLGPEDLVPNPFGDKGKDFFKVEYSAFGAEDGQYLANNIGEPLVKGLTELARLKPRDPIAFLANFLINFVNSGKQPQQRPPTNNNKEVGMESIGQRDSLERSVEFQDDSERGESLEGFDEDDILGEEEQNDTGGNEARASSVRQESPQPEEEPFKEVQRDEHGQSMLHYAAARSHGRNGLLQLLQEVEGNVGLRDGLYRTARDIAEQVDLPENAQAIDKYVVGIAARGENDKLEELILEGYDHILDAKDGEETIQEIVQNRENSQETIALLKGIPSFEEKRERLHRAIRFGSTSQVNELVKAAKGLALGRNQQGRTSLHVAVLCQHEPIVQLIANKFKKTLHIGDNLMRTPLHYAMGVDKVEALSSILIKAGAHRVVKDLRGRQPSYYFMNKTEIQKLQDEEEALTV